MTIHAYTEPRGPLPAYINISERVADLRAVVITVRGSGENNSSSIILEREQLRSLATDIMIYLGQQDRTIAALAAPVPGANIHGIGPDTAIELVAPAGGSVITFGAFVQHGRDNGANIVGGMPWSWTYLGHPVSHENDRCYLVGCPSLRFTPDDVLRTDAMGKLSVETLAKIKPIGDSLTRSPV